MHLSPDPTQWVGTGHETKFSTTHLKNIRNSGTSRKNALEGLSKKIFLNTSICIQIYIRCNLYRLV